MCSFAGNVTYPKATDLQEAVARVPDDLLLVETDAPFLAPAARAGQAERPGQRRSHGAEGRRAARRLVRPARAARRAQRRARLRLVSGQGSIRRLREFDVRPNRELGQNFLVDDNVLRLVGDAAELAPDGRRPRGGRRAGRPLRASRAARAASARGRGGPLARAGAARRGRRVRQRRPSLRGRRRPRHGRAAAAARQGRGEPAVRRCGHGDPEVGRGAARRAALDRDGAARGRAAARGGAGVEDLRRDERARPALVRGEGAAADLAQRLPSGAERGVGARAAQACGASARRRRRRAGARGVCPPPQGAAALARAQGLRPRATHRRRSSRSGTRPTRARSACRRTTSAGSRRYCARDLASGRPRRSTCCCTWARGATTACTSCARSSRRSTWPTP